jgi:hypothetical protein
MASCAQPHAVFRDTFTSYTSTSDTFTSDTFTSNTYEPLKLSTN